MGTVDLQRSLFKLSKWISVLSCLFLLASVLDNIPDCPQLLNQKDAACVTVQSGCPLDNALTPKCLASTFIARSVLPLGGEFTVEAGKLLPMPHVLWSLARASDPSPPSA